MKLSPLNCLLAALTFAGVVAGCSGDDSNSSGSSTPPLPAKIGHVFIIVLENENADTTFGPGSPAPYLSQTLPTLGLFLPNYYGTGHLSNDNYLSMVSGQAPNADTQADCQFYSDFIGTSDPDSDGQVTGQGCVYPPKILTIGDQLDAAGLTWRGYMEDMGNTPTRDDPTTCAQPETPPVRDATQSSTVADQYATRHNPFMYFHSIIDRPDYCHAHVVPLAALTADLVSVATTPNYVFITPNLCNDGHDAPCTGKDISGTGNEGGLISADRFLQYWVPKIMASPAFAQDGLLIVTFDEAELSQSDPAGSDFTACCNEPSGPNTPAPGIFTGPSGSGGGRVGAVLISRFIQPGSTSTTAFNHYSMLKSIEDIFGLSYLGYAGQSGLEPFGTLLYSATP